jgi:hypothetical protein
MKRIPGYFLCPFLLIALAANSAFSAQGPRGVGGDIKVEKVQKASNPKPEKPVPLYTFPHTTSWWQGGGPGPVGAGAGTKQHALSRLLTYSRI